MYEGIVPVAVQLVDYSSTDCGKLETKMTLSFASSLRVELT